MSFFIVDELFWLELISIVQEIYWNLQSSFPSTLAHQVSFQCAEDGPLIGSTLVTWAWTFSCSVGNVFFYRCQVMTCFVPVEWAIDDWYFMWLRSTFGTAMIQTWQPSDSYDSTPSSTNLSCGSHVYLSFVWFSGPYPRRSLCWLRVSFFPFGLTTIFISESFSFTLGLTTCIDKVD